MSGFSGHGGTRSAGEGGGARRITEVVAGIVVEGSLVLVAQRHRNQSYPLLWEFPGGKVEPDETPEAALAREFREELDVEVRAVRPYDRIEYAGRDGGAIRVTFYLAARESGEPRPVEVESVTWVPWEALSEVDFIPANREIVERLRGEMERGALEGR